jgi:hypothetical protein
LLVLVEVVEHGLSPVYDFSRQTINRSRKAGDRTMPEKIIQVNQPMFETELDRMVSEKVNEILNRMLDAEADEIAGAARYERSCGRKAYRAGHYERDLTVKAGKMAVRVPKLKGALFESAVIELYLVKSVFRFLSGIFFGFMQGACGRWFIVWFCRT